MTIYMFHGACTGCTQQEKHGVDFCRRCCNFNANWDLPDLNNRPLTPAEIKRAQMLAEIKRAQMLAEIKRAQMLAEEPQEISND